MKNKFGFTLVELIVVIAILGILMGISIPTVSLLLKKFRSDYYEKLESSIELAAQTYISDNKSKRPVNGKQTTILIYGEQGLIKKGYIDEVVDYKKKECDWNSSKVLVERKDNKYTYKVCLVCNDDGYSSCN